jgi:hypothetical protein
MNLSTTSVKQLIDQGHRIQTSVKGSFEESF